MKIIYLHRTQGIGVEAVHIKGMIRAMENAGHEIYLFGPKLKKSNQKINKNNKPGIMSLFAKYAPEFFFEIAELIYDQYCRIRLCKVVKNFQPDFIYERYAFFACAGCSVASSFDIPHVVEVNYTTKDALFRNRSKLLMPFAQKVEKKIFSNAKAIAAVSSKLVDHLKSFGVKENRITLTPNAVAKDFFSKVINTTPKTLPNNICQRTVIGFIGGFYPWHGLKFLIDAISQINDNQVSLLLIGDGPERLKIKKQITNENIYALLPGDIPHTELISWILTMDICILPHSNEYGSPMKVFEYMACGKPVVAPKLPPLTDVITSGTEGFLFKTGNLNSLINKLEKLIFDKKLQKIMGENAKETALKNHTWDKNFERIIKVARIKTKKEIGII